MLFLDLEKSSRQILKYKTLLRKITLHLRALPMSLTNKIISYSLMSAIFLNINVLTISVMVTGLSAFSKNTFATESKTKILDNINRKYDLKNPERNHKVDGITDAMVEQINRPSVGLSGKLNKYLSSPRQSMALTLINDNKTLEAERFDNARKLATSISKTHAQPNQNADEKTSLSYSKSGTRQFYRDSEGKLKIRVVENVDRVDANLHNNELFGSDYDNTQYDFQADKSYGDEKGLFKEGRKTHSNLETGKTGAARGYQAITKSIDRAVNAPISSNDPVITKGLNQLSNIEKSSGEFFQSCTTSTSTKTTRINNPVYEEHYCQDTKSDNKFFCEVERIYNVTHAIQDVSGEADVSACGDGCVDITLGTGTKKKREGQCWDESYSASIVFNPKLSLSNVSVRYAIEDHATMSINGAQVWSVIKGAEGINGSLPAKGNGCIRKPLYSGSHSGSAYSAINNAVKSNDGIVNFYLTVRYGEEGEGKVSLRLNFTEPTGLGFGIKYKQYPEGCYDAVTPEIRTVNGLHGLLEGGGTGNSIPDVYSYTCRSDFNCSGTGADHGFDNRFCEASGSIKQNWLCRVPSSDYMRSDDSSDSGIAIGLNGQARQFSHSFCRFESYSPITIDDGGLPLAVKNSVPPWYKGDAGDKTWKVNLDGYVCDPMGGHEWCVPSKETGEPVCYTWDDMKDKPDMCALYEEDAACSEIARDCAEGWYDEVNKVCFSETVTYRCNRGTPVEYTYEEIGNTCEAALPCSGGDCDFGESETNTKFIEAAATASVLQNMKDDRACTDPSNPATCTIFEGESKFCSWELSGLGVDCCERPKGLNILSYVQFAQSMLRIDAMAVDGAFGQATKGAYTALRDPVTNVWQSYFTEPLTSAADSLVGNFSGGVSASAGERASEFSLDIVLDKVKEQMMQMAYDMLPEGLANMIFDVSASGVVQGLSDQASQTLNFLSNVMAVYAAYQIIKLALTLLTACEEEEMDMGTKLAQRVCFKRGDKYCNKDFLGVCYQRRQDYCCYNSILARVVMEQATPLLNKDVSQCQGLTQSELSNLDWNRINLDEWVALLIDSGEIPSTTSEQLLTGGGRIENSHARETASVRNKKRMEGAAKFSEDLKNKTLKGLNTLDCSVYPRPPICEFGVDVRGN